MRWLRQARLRFLRGRIGISLIETVVALGILGLIGVAFLTALSTTSKSTDLYQQRVTAASLAQSQLEIVKAAPYDDIPPYYGDVSSPVSVPPGYNITISTVQQEVGKQEITVAVSRDGHSLLKLTTLKVNW